MLNEVEQLRPKCVQPVIQLLSFIDVVPPDDQIVETAWTRVHPCNHRLQVCHRVRTCGANVNLSRYF